MVRIVLTKKDNLFIKASFFDDRGLESMECLDYAEVTGDEPRLGDVYVGRVTKYLKNLSAAFVDIKKGLSCYMAVSERDGIVKQEDAVLVQLEKEALKTKEPVVTRNISISSVHLVLTRKEPIVSVSKKITDKKERERLKGILEKESLPFAVLFRTNCEGVADEVLLAEYRQLCTKLTDIISKATGRVNYSLMYREMPRYIKEILSYKPETLEFIVTDDKVIYDELLLYLKEYMGSEKLRLYEDERVSLYNLYSIGKHMEELSGKNVWLKCGGYLVIEQTEALNVIDVNTGKYVKKKNSEEAAMVVNTEAAIEAARQMRLRNLSGIIIIDFINCSSENEKILAEVLREEFKKDGNHPVLVDVTKLGLFEVTRKKVTRSFKEMVGYYSAFYGIK